MKDDAQNSINNKNSINTTVSKKVALLSTLDILLLVGRSAFAIAFLGIAIAVWLPRFRTWLGLWMFRRFHHHHQIPPKAVLAATLACLAIAVLFLFPLPKFTPEQPEILCTPPYTVLNTTCCLDMNSNARCDTPEELQPPVQECEQVSTIAPIIEDIKPPERPTASPYRAASVITGDTFELVGGDTVRLLCIDAPEYGEPYHEESKAALSRLILNRDLILTNGTVDTDSGGRLLRYVYIQDKFINMHLIEEGYSFAYRPSLPSPDEPICTTFLEAEQISRMRGFGMWGKLQWQDHNQSPSIAVSPSPPYDCTLDKYDCDDFADRANAQDAYDACGGPEKDVHFLDQDKNGMACEGFMAGT